MEPGLSINRPPVGIAVMKQDTRELLGLEKYFLWCYASIPALVLGVVVENVWLFSGLFVIATVLLAVFAWMAMRRYFGPQVLSASTRRVGVFTVIAWSLCHMALVAGKYYLWSRDLTVIGVIRDLMSG